MRRCLGTGILLEEASLANSSVSPQRSQPGLVFLSRMMSITLASQTGDRQNSLRVPSWEHPWVFGHQHLLNNLVRMAAFMDVLLNTKDDNAEMIWCLFTLNEGLLPFAWTQRCASKHERWTWHPRISSKLSEGKEASNRADGSFYGCASKHERW